MNLCDSLELKDVMLGMRSTFVQLKTSSIGQSRIDVAYNELISLEMQVYMHAGWHIITTAIYK